MALKKTKTTKKSSAAHTPKKRFHHHHFPMIPLGSWILFWFFVAVTILLSTVCFTKVLDTTGRYATSTATVGSLATQQALETQVAELQGQVTKGGTPSGRVLVNVEDIYTDNTSLESCVIQLDHTTATQSILWKDEETGLQAVIPYSFSWGNDQYALTPYEKATSYDNAITAVAFGPAVTVYQCSLGRAIVLSVTSSTDSGPRLREIQKEPGLEGTVRQRTINGITVLSYKIGELGGGTYWEGFGRSYHYQISSQGWLTDAEAIKIIQSLKVVK